MNVSIKQGQSEPAHFAEREKGRAKSSTTSNSINCLLRIVHLWAGSPSTRILIAASILIAIGYILMSGPGSTEDTFNPDIFSTRRIVIAPLLCLAGYLLMVVGVLRRK